jgi:hypothetical protein
VHPLILTKPAKNSSSFLTITGKSHVQRQIAAYFCEGIMYPEQEYSQQNSLLYWLLDGEMGLPGCTSQNAIGRSFNACGKLHVEAAKLLAKLCVSVGVYQSNHIIYLTYFFYV